MNEAITRIAIVGGGSAGWITAGLIAAEYSSSSGQGVEVTLIESPDVKTIGVGEGTWPTMRTTLLKIGLSEAEFLKACSASFKQGTKFSGWVNGDASDIYYHPFSAPAGYGSVNLVPHWQQQKNNVSFVDAVGIQGYLCDRGLAPKQLETPEYAAVANYGYHLDAGKFAELLQRHCTLKLGVRHVIDHVTSVNGTFDEDIQSLATTKSGDIEAELFVDCTGSAALLIGRHYQIPYVDKKSILFNDAALAVQIPYDDKNSPIASQTNSTGQSSGWIWDIGLTSRRGIGYVYSTAHSSDDEALATLQDYVSATSTSDVSSIEPRKISFRPGHREKFWHRNCVAVGMSAGFLEPLEASALVLVELSARMICEELPTTRSVMTLVEKRFNEKFLYRWDRIVDFLKLHYVLSQRSDSQYWIDNRRSESIPESLRDLLEVWRFQVPGRNDFPQVDEVFSAASYQYVLYGMGFETQVRRSRGYAQHGEKAAQLFTQNTRTANKLVANLERNRELINKIERRHGAS